MKEGPEIDEIGPHPKICFEIVTGISKTPGTLIIFKEKLLKLLFALFKSDEEMSS